ncbi:MAG: hypothetical protein Ta2D_04120 [Rickettsiales bacterium]|nr:MAG: hypothetical protein Ta2D_04120 [Rickettsiales bacterium]
MSLYLEYSNTDIHCNIKPEQNNIFFDLERANRLVGVSKLIYR